jgi:hypothetical protein
MFASSELCATAADAGREKAGWHGPHVCAVRAIQLADVVYPALELLGAGVDDSVAVALGVVESVVLPDEVGEPESVLVGVAEPESDVVPESLADVLGLLDGLVLGLFDGVGLVVGFDVGPEVGTPSGAPGSAGGSFGLVVGTEDDGGGVGVMRPAPCAYCDSTDMTSEM